MPRGEILATSKHVGNLGPQVRLLFGAEIDALGRRCLGIYDRGGNDPILRLCQENNSAPVMDRSSAHLAWGNRDGTITVCDLPEIHRQLEALGLGW